MLGKVGTSGALPVSCNHLTWFVEISIILGSLVSKPGLDTCTLSPGLAYGCVLSGFRL